MTLSLPNTGIAVTIDIGDANALPSEHFLPLARLLANEAAPSFGAAFSLDVKLENERQLRKLTANRATRETLRTKYF